MGQSHSNEHTLSPTQIDKNGTAPKTPIINGNYSSTVDPTKLEKQIKIIKEDYTNPLNSDTLEASNIIQSIYQLY